MDAKEAVYVWT